MCLFFWQNVIPTGEDPPFGMVNIFRKFDSNEDSGFMSDACISFIVQKTSEIAKEK